MIHSLLSFRVLFPLCALSLGLLTLYFFAGDGRPPQKTIPGIMPAATLATPDIRTITHLPNMPTPSYAMRAKLFDADVYVGLALTCSPETPSGITITTFFGPFPQDGRPVQLAVKTLDNQVLHFGSAVRARPNAGFHSPQLQDATHVDSFLRAALRPGSLISNGYRSFWNRASAHDNLTARDAILGCLKTPS